jgi:rubrerythrin
MGVFTAWLWYRHGKNKGRREREAQLADELEQWGDDYCSNCGYLASQHDEHGRCPSYD